MYTHNGVWCDVNKTRLFCVRISHQTKSWNESNYCNVEMFESIDPAIQKTKCLKRLTLIQLLIEMYSNASWMWCSFSRKKSFKRNATWFMEWKFYYCAIFHQDNRRSTFNWATVEVVNCCFSILFFQHWINVEFPYRI